MKRLQRAALLVELADYLQIQGSWCGETHLQKTIYFLQYLLDVPTEFNFILYKFGPFSFDLRDELTALQADGLLALRVRHPAYGPALSPTKESEAFRRHYPVTLHIYRDALKFVCGTLGSKGVTELERLATALYVTRELGSHARTTERAMRLNMLKPHISVAEAEITVEEFDAIAAEAAALARTE